MIQELDDPKYQHIPIGQLIMQFGEKQHVGTATAFLEDKNYTQNKYVLGFPCKMMYEYMFGKDSTKIWGYPGEKEREVLWECKEVQQFRMIKEL